MKGVDFLEVVNKNSKNESQQTHSTIQTQQDTPQMKSEFLEFYDSFKQFYNQHSNQNQPLVFDFNAFNKATENRVHDSKGSKYSKEQTRVYLLNPQRYEKEIRNSSIYLYGTFQEYKHLVDYMSKMLTHDFILVPDGININNIDMKKLLDSFYINLEFIENYNIKSKLQSIESILIREDFYFGYERSDGDNFIWQRLPSDYCRLLGTDEYGCIIFEFDFSYFNKRSLALDNFDSEFNKKYEVYKKDAKLRWQQLSEKAICFKLDVSVLYGLPYFSGIFTDLMGLEDYKDEQEDSNRANNYKLIALEIPIYDKEKGINQYLVTLDHIAEFVSNAQKNTPDKVGLFAYPGKAEALNLNNSNSHFEENIVSKAQNDLMTSAGVSKLVGNSEKTSMGLERSIQDDESVMFSLLRQYELWFKKRLKLFNKKMKWRLSFLDVTVYNRDKVFEKYLKSGISGFPKFAIGACLGYSQSEFIGLLAIENQLGLVEDLLKVLPSSNTQNTSDEGGRPGKDTQDKKDISIVTDDKESNKRNFDEED